MPLPTLEEAQLRAFANGTATEPMGSLEREWCLREIDRVEGHSRYTFDLRATDAEIAQGVLEAWLDYAQDKGLI